MADDELLLGGITAYLEAAEPFPARSSLPGVEMLVQPFEGQVFEQQQTTAHCDIPQHQQKQQKVPAHNPQLSQSESVRQQQGCAKIELKTRNPSREKMQRELKHLRVHSKNLQQQLAFLNKQQEQKQKQKLLSSATWKHTARQELEARIHAEMENQRLKTQLAQQMAFTQNFHRFIGDSKYPSFVEPQNEVDTRLNVEIAADDIAIFESLSLELDAAYSRMEATFDENGLNAWQVGKPIVFKTQMKAWHPNGTTDADLMRIELTNTNVLPFPVGLVFRTFWECCERQKSQRGYVAHNYQDASKATTAIKSHIGIYFNGRHVSLEYLSIAKVYTKDDRINFVWRSRTKACPNFPDMYVDETSWQVMKPVTVPGGYKLSSSGATAILVCTQLEFKRLSGSLNVHEKTGDDQLVDLVVSAIEEDMVQVNAMMMDTLLQGSLSVP